MYDNFNGIKLFSSDKNVISNNSLSGNDIGMKLEYSSKNTIILNNLSKNSMNGLHIFSFSSENGIYQNTFQQNGDDGIRVEHSNINIIRFNNISDHTDGGDNGILLNKANSTQIEQNLIIRNDNGLYIYQSIDCAVSRNFLLNNTDSDISLMFSGGNSLYKNIIQKSWRGIYLEMSTNNSILENNISLSLNNGKGIYMVNSYYNMIQENNIHNIDEEGILLENFCENNIIYKNSIGFNDKGIYLVDNSQRNHIVENKIFNSTDVQIHLFDSGLNRIELNNIVNGSIDGILIESSGVKDDHNVIQYNNFTKNQGFGVNINQFSISNLVIFNNFKNNNKGGIQGYSWSNLNKWDNSSFKHGNYWDNHTSPDNNSDGIIDNPYRITGSISYDQFPLKYPFKYYDLSKISVNLSYNNYTIGWNVTKFNNTADALKKLERTDFFKDPSTITIYNGEYNEGSLWINRKDVAIIGKNRNKVIFNSSLNQIFIVNATNVKISNMTIMNAAISGITVKESNSTIEKCTLFNNTFGITLLNPGQTKIFDCNISFNQIGISIQTQNSDHIGSKIRNNYIANNTNNGIELIALNPFSLNNILIEKNNITGNDIGIFAQDGFYNSLIVSNNISSQKNDGIRLGFFSIGNNISKNLIQKNGYKGGGTSYGIFIDSNTDNKIFLNDFIKNNLGSVYNQVYDNDLGSPDVWYGLVSKRWVGNYWSNWKKGVDNNLDGIYDNPYIINVTASDLFPLVSSSQYYNFTEIHVDDNYNSNTPGFGATRFNTTFNGINAVREGGFVYVHNGTYKENIVIIKSLKLIGDDPKGTIIGARLNGPVINILADDIQISKITVRNDSVGDYGIFLNSVNDINLEDLNVSNNYIGIYVFNSNRIKIKDSLIGINNNSGILVKVSNEITIINNTFYSNLETNSTWDISLDGNKFYNSGWIFIASSKEEALSHNVPETNKVNDEALLYVKNSNFNFHDVDLGQLILVNVNSSIGCNKIFNNVPIGIMAYYCYDNSFYNIDFNNVIIGMVLIDSNNNTISGNLFKDCHDKGMLIIHSNYNEIYGNQFISCENIGIQIQDGANQNEIYINGFKTNRIGINIEEFIMKTKVYCNEFANNSEYAISVKSYNENKFFRNNFYDNGNNQSLDDENIFSMWNYWDNDEKYTERRGNYWNNFKKRYPLATPNYTTGEWEGYDYQLDGAAWFSDPNSGRDMFPLLNPYPIGPILTILNPSNKSWFANQPNISIKIKNEFFEVAKKWLRVNNGPKIFFTDNKSINLNWDSYPSVATLNVVFYANNTYGWEGQSGTLIIKKDAKPPSLTINSYDNDADYGTGAINIQITASDNHKLRDKNPVQASFYEPDSTFIGTFNMTQLGNTSIYTYTWSVGSYAPDVNYYFKVSAYDFLNNVNTSANCYFNITDRVNPTVIIESYTKNTEYAIGPIYVNATIYDNHQLALPISIRFYRPGGSVIGTYSMTYDGGNTYLYTWNVGSESPANNYYFRIIAKDKSDNTNDTEIAYFNITDTHNPSVVIDSYDAVADYGTGSISVSSTITDNHHVASVIIKFYRPGGALIGSYTMNNPGGNTYEYTWNVGAEIPNTNYYFVIIANDSVGNSNNTESRTFNIEDNVNPSISGITYDNTVEWDIGSLPISCIVTDNYKLRDNNPVEVRIFYPNGTVILDWTAMVSVGGNTYNYTWSVSGYDLGNNYYFRIRATDNQSNSIISGSQFFDIIDTQNPQIIDLAYNTPVEWNTGTLIIRCNVSDNYQLRGTNPVEIRIFDPVNTPLIDWSPMIFHAGNEYNYSWDVVGNDIGNNYYFIIRATDTSSNTFTTGNNNFTIIDSVDPIISDISYNNPIEWNTGTLSISCNVTDNYGLRAANPVEIIIYYPGGSVLQTWTSMTLSGSYYTYSFSVVGYDIDNNYYFIIRATDISSNVILTNNQYFNITDTVTPQIFDISYNTPVEWGTGKLEVICNATDNYGLRAINPVEIIIRYPNNTIALGWTAMIFISGNRYAYNWSVLGYRLGIGYTFRIRATDVSGNSLTSGSNSFNIEDNIDPEIPDISYNTPVEWSTGTLEIKCNATDNHQLNTSNPVEVRIYNPSGTPLISWTAMISQGGNRYAYNWSVSGYDIGQNFYFIIRAIDASSNSFTTVNQNFDITDTVDPQISNINYNTPIEWGTGTLSVTCDATDNRQLKTTDPVQIKIYYPNSTFILDWTAMTFVSGNEYSYDWSASGYNLGAG
ncbi:MAG: NosD domain-containing protein, partial [Promethearchaeota archaeon]